jgi:YesN/AraC family two-component response regulator
MAAAPGAPMLVIATAYHEHSLEAFDLGVVDYLLKPFSEECVEQCLRRLAARRPERRAGSFRVVARKKRLVYLAIPWRYVLAHYIKARAERWR